MTRPPVPDSAAAVQWLERAAAAQDEANRLHAEADAYDARTDRDDLDGDCRREVVRLLNAAAARVEQKADDCRERAADARSLRRHRHDAEQEKARGNFDPFAEQYDRGRTA